MGIRTVMITGHNPLTARAIATEAGVDDLLAEATPEDRMVLIRREQGGERLVTMTGDGSSGSGVDPHISVANARLQAPRVADERGLSLDDVERLIDDHTSSRPLGVLGETGVNVLQLNLALDDLAG